MGYNVVEWGMFIKTFVDTPDLRTVERR